MDVDWDKATDKQLVEVIANLTEMIEQLKKQTGLYATMRDALQYKLDKRSKK